MNLSNEEVIKLLVLLNIMLHDTTTLRQKAKSIEEHATLQGHQETIRWWIHRLSRMEPESEDAHGGE